MKRSPPDAAPQTPEKSSRVLAILAGVGAVFSLALLLALLGYKHGNDSNHTGFEPWLLSLIFFPTAALGIATVVRSGPRWIGILAFCLGLGCMAFLFYLDYFNVLVQYERWIARGMP